jgi:transcription elongation factor Elf1
MNATWQTKTPCRKCGASLVVTAQAGPSDGPTLAVFYCPACGERTQVEVPTGCDPLSVSATQDAG